MSEEKHHNVRAFRTREVEQPEDALRTALSTCAEIRSREKMPYVVVLVGEEEHLPAMYRSKLFTSDMAVCAARLQAELMEFIRDDYSE